MSPVHYAALEGHVNALTILLSHHAYANFMDFSENRYMYIICRRPMDIIYTMM